MKHYLSLLIFLFICIACEKESVNNSTVESEHNESSEYIISSPIHFDSVESLVSHMWEDKSDINVKSLPSFISFAETVMREPGYDDKPNAILSERFGSILNSEGEVEFANYLLKVSDCGILFAPLQKKEVIRKLCKENDIISKCKEKIKCVDINPNAIFYKIEGYDGVVLYDTFHIISKEDDSIGGIETRTIASNLQQRVLSGPLTTFTAPSAGDQKVLFEDSKYCNDTKAFQQNYAVASDGGLKTKTMKKTLGIWNKISNPIEGGITLFSIFEYGTFDSINTDYPDINKVSYGGVTKYVYTISARGTTAQSLVPVNIANLLSQGNALAENSGLDISIDGIRFVLNNTTAVTVFDNETKSGTLEKIDYNWPVPLTGDTSVTQSYLGRTDVPNYASYYVVGFLAYGQSTRNREIRGSAIGYNYWAN